MAVTAVLVAGTVGPPLGASLLAPSAGAVTPIESPTPTAAARIILAPTSSEVRIGETMAFVAEVTNTSDADLVGLRVTGESLGTDASLLGARVSTGVFDPASTTWFVERVAPGGSATLELFARAEATGQARVALLAAAAEPAGALATAESNVAITNWRASPDADGQLDTTVTAAVVLVAGGTLVALAGLLHFRRRPEVADH